MPKKNRLSSGSYLPYNEAKYLIQKFDFKTKSHFEIGRKAELKSLYCIPSNPDAHYKEWEGWTKFLRSEED